MGLSREIQSKEGMENQVADALSRREENNSECMAIIEVTLVWIGDVMTNYQGDKENKVKITALLHNSNSESDYH